MANRLNVLVGATLEQNVEKKLNAELAKLNLNALELEAKFDNNFKDIVDNIKKAITAVDFNKVNQGFKQGADSVDNIGKSMNELDGKVKKVVRTSKDLSGKLKSAEETLEDMSGNKYRIKVQYDEFGKISGGNIDYIDNTARQKQLDLEKKSARAIDAQRKATTKEYLTRLRWQSQEEEKSAKAQKKNWQDILSTVGNAENVLGDITDKYKDLRDVDNKKFLNKKEIDGYNNRLNKLINDVVKYKDNSKELARVQKELNSLYSELNSRKTGLAEAVETDKKARDAKAKYNEEVKKSKQTLEELGNIARTSRQKLDALKTAFPEMDFSEEEKEVKSLEGAFLSYSRQIRQTGKDAQWFTDLNNKMISKQRDANSLDGKLDSRYNKEVELRRQIVAEEIEQNNKKYRAELRWNSQIEEAKRKAAEKEHNRKQREYEELFDEEDRKQREAQEQAEKAEYENYQRNLRANSLANAELSKTADLYDTVSAKVKELKGAYSGAIGDNGQFDAFEKELEEIISDMAKYSNSAEVMITLQERLNKVLKASNDSGSFNSSIRSMIDSFNAETEREVINLRTQYGDTFNEAEFRKRRDLEKEIAEIIKTQGYNLDACRKVKAKLTSQSKDFKTELASSSKEIRHIRQEAELLNTSLGRFIQFYGFGELFRGIKTAATSMFEQIKLVDSAMVELKKVTEETDYAYEKFLDGAADKAKTLGVTMSDYVDSVTEFARMGETFGDSQVLAESANIMQMVSENLTAEQASQYLISTMKGFNLEAEKSMAIVDALNNVSNNFSITTDGLGEALKRSSASMASANNTLEETIALITTANEVTQNPEAVGNALKTVSMRIRGVVADDDEDSGTVLEPAKLGQIIQEVTSKYSDTGVGISIMADEDTFKSTYQILYELSEVWDDLKDTEQAYLLEKISGKHRATQIAAILSNGERLSEAYAAALQSSGSAMEEFEKRTESVEYHLAQLSASWQELSTNAVTVDFVNNIIDGLRTIVETINELGVVNSITSVAGALGGFMINFKGIPFLEAIGKEELLEKKKAIEELGEGAEKAAEIIAKKSPLAVGAIKMLTTAVKGLLGTVGVTVGIYAIMKLLGFVFEKFEEYNNRAQDAQDAVNSISSEINNLQTEYELLSGKETLTDVEKERLSVLEDEIALQKADLELSKQRLADINYQKYNSTTKSLHGDGVVTSSVVTADELLSDEIENTAYQYGNATAKIKTLREELSNYKKQTDDVTISEEERQIALENLKRIKQELSVAQTQLTTAEGQLQENYDSLLTQESELTNIIENKIGLTEDEIASYKKKLALTQNNIDLYRVLLGLEEADAEYTKTQLDGLKKTEAVNRVMKEMKSEAGLSKEALDELKEVYPDLSDEIELYGIVAGETYDESSTAVRALEIAHRSAFNAMNDDQLTATIVARDNAIARLEQYKNEAEALKSLYETQSQAQQNATNKLMDGKLSLSDIGASIQAVDGNILSSVSALLYENKNAEINKLNEQIRSYDEIIAAFESAAERAAEITGPNGDGDNSSGSGGTGGGGSGDKDSKKADVWDKYAHALAKANDEIERYNRVCEITQAKLDNNQSIEERNLDLISQEIQLYDELIANTQAKYKIVNDTLWAQQQGLQQLYAEASKHMGISAEEVAGLTDAELEAFIELKLDEDKANDQKIAHLLNGIVDMRQNVHDLHIDWLALKSDILELKNEQINVQINFQNDVTEKFEESRESASAVLDILEEIEGTEERRVELLNSMIDSYTTEFNTNLKMYEETEQNLLRMAEDGLQNSDQYNATLKEAHRLEMRNLEIIQEQLDAQLKQIDAERQLAFQRNESLVYGEQGKDAWEKSREREIDRLQNQLDALEEDTSEADYLEQLAEKEEHIAELEEKLANLRNQKTIQQLKQQEDGSFQWEYVEDQRAINETMEELEDARNDLQKTKDDKALQDRKDAIQSEIDAMEDEISERAERLEIMNEQDEEYYAEQERMAQENAEANIKILEDRIARTSQALNTLENRTRTGLREVDAQTEAGLKNLSDTYSEWLGAMSVGISSWVEQIIEEFNRLEAAQRAAAEEAASMVPGGGSSSSPPPAAGGIKFVEANNFLARLHYGERVLTRQEASQYNELEDDIKSGKLQSYFDSLQEDTALSISNVAATTVAKSATVPTVGSAVTSFVIEHLELPQVKDPTDFAAVINEWARGEFGGLAQKARIIPAR